MSALNRSMFKKQIVNREEGSPLEGEDSSGGVLQALLQSIKNLATDGFTMNDTEMLDESTELENPIPKQIQGIVLREGEFETQDGAIIREGEYTIDQNGVVREGEYLRPDGAVIREGENIYNDAEFNFRYNVDPNSVVREGEEGYQYDFDIDGKNKSFGFDEKLAPSGVESFREKLGITADPNSVVREGELMNMRSIPRSVLREGELMNMMDPNSVVRESETRFRQMGSPPQGEMIEEQVNVEDVGIMDGFSGGEEETAAAVLQEGERSKKEIDDADTYDELMRSVRGDDLSEEERRQELASVVGEKDAEETPDSVLALVQPVLQMLSEDTANTGIGQIEEGQEMANVMPTQAGATDAMAMMMPEQPVGVANGGYMSSFPNQNMGTQSLTASDNIDDRIMQNLQFERMAPGMMGYAEGGLVQPYALGGDVRPIPKYSNGTSSVGATINDITANNSLLDNTLLDNEVVDSSQDDDIAFLDLLMQANSVEPGQSALKTKYDTNYKLFSEILGGQGPSKDEKIGEILTSVVSPLAFQYAQGADIQELLAAGTQAIGKISQKYSAAERKSESEIKSAALAQSLKPGAADPLIKVFTIDDPATKNNEEKAVMRLTSEVIKNSDLYSAESVTKAQAEINKLNKETDKIQTEVALNELDLKYGDKFKNIEYSTKLVALDNSKSLLAINEAIADQKPEELIANLKSLNLDNAKKVIENEFLRPTSVIELETLSVNLDQEIQNLKIKEIEANFTQQEKLLGVEERQGIIDERLQTIDFNKNNNILLLEQKNAEIDNIILTGKNIDLENDYKTIQNNYANDQFSEQNKGLLLDNISKRLENIKLSTENKYIDEKEKLSIDKTKADIENQIQNTLGIITSNEKDEIELKNYDEKLNLELNLKMLEAETLEYKLNNPEKDWKETKTVIDYKNKWIDSEVYKNTVERQGTMQQLLRTANESTGAGDLSFIFTYMKFLDPDSVVRESEFNTAADAGGAKEKFKNFRDKILGGNLLTDKTKRAFLATAAKMYVDQLNNYNRQYETERKIALDLFGEDQVKNAIPKIDFDIQLMNQLKNMETIDAFLLKDNTDAGNFEEN